MAVVSQRFAAIDESVTLNVCDHVSACLFSLKVDKAGWYNFQNKFKKQVMIKENRFSKYSWCHAVPHLQVQGFSFTHE